MGNIRTFTKSDSDTVAVLILQLLWSDELVHYTMLNMIDETAFKHGLTYLNSAHQRISFVACSSFNR